MFIVYSIYYGTVCYDTNNNDHIRTVPYMKLQKESVRCDKNCCLKEMSSYVCPNKFAVAE